MPISINGSTGISGVDGSAGTPALQGSDSNTGIAFGADTIIGSTGGSERFRVDSSGRLGIGTTTPGQSLDVNGNIRVGSNQRVMFGPAGFEAGIKYSSSGNFQIAARAGEAITFNGGEDGTERARIDSSGRLLVGTSSTRTVSFWDTPQVQIEGLDYQKSSLSIYNNQNEIYGAYLALGHSRGTSNGSNTIVQSNDYLGTVAFFGSDGSNEIRGAEISAFVDGTPGANDMPGRLVFSTTADGAASPTARFTIFRDGATEIAGNYRPTADNSYNLGGAGQRWATVYAANGTINTSDGREKTNVEDSALGADFIKSLRPVSYKWIEGGKRELPERDEHGNIVYETLPGQRTHWGFIAQEVKEVVDETGVDFGGWILTDKDDPDSQQGLRYHEFIAPLTKALQEALEKIESLETRLAALEVTP